MLNLPGLREEIVLDTADIDEKLWVPQPGTPDIQFYPLLFDTAQGTFANVLRSRKKGFLNRHRHHGTVYVYTIKGEFRYLEHDWVAKLGTFVFEPPGEIHTLYADTADEMKILSIISGGLTFLDERNEPIGYMDVFTKIDACQKHYSSIGLGSDYVQQFIR